jgi:cysteine-rich repeat protein
MAKSESDSSTRRIWAVVVAHLIAVAAVLVFVGGATPARAAIVNFTASIDGAQETTCPNPTTAQGAATVTLDDVSGLLSWNITFGNNSPSFNNGLLDNGAETLAHFHGPAPPGMTAGVKVSITPPAPIGSPKMSSATVASAGDRTDLKNGLWYINIHAQPPCGGGEIRGQVLRVPTCGDGILDGGETCDDGNNTSGDCCSATCQLEADGNTCQSFGTCNAGVCDVPNHYACYQVKHKLPKGQTGTISNDVELAGTFSKCKLKFLCTPTVKNSSPIQNPDLNYCCHQCKGGKPAVAYTITDQFVSGAITTKKLKLICNPCVKQ